METHGHLKFIELILRQEPEELCVESSSHEFARARYRHDFRFEDTSGNGTIHTTVLVPTNPTRMPEVYRVLIRAARRGIIENPFAIISRDYALLKQCFNREQLRPHFVRLNQVRGVV